jgi:stage III sporulation protein AD
MLGLVVTVILKGLRPDFATFTGIVTALILLALSIGSIASVIRSLTTLADETGFSVYTTMILKTLGIGLLSQVTADVCRDNGAASIASKVEFAAKILILSLCIPILKLLLSYIAGFLG